jgi:hypothetical protein
MKKFSYFLILILLILSCDKHFVTKPENLIDEDKMILILYDMAVIEAIKVQNPNNLTIIGVDENNYILKKYKIDSLQFSNSNKYYASDLENYSKMYEKIENRLTEEKNQTDTLVKKGVNLNTKQAADTIDYNKVKRKKSAQIKGL